MLHTRPEIGFGNCGGHLPEFAAARCLDAIVCFRAGRCDSGGDRTSMTVAPFPLSTYGSSDKRAPVAGMTRRNRFAAPVAGITRRNRMCGARCATISAHDPDAGGRRQ